MDEQKRAKEPAHDLIPVLIAAIDERRKRSNSNTKESLGTRIAFEITIEAICQMVGMMVIPQQHLAEFLTKIKAVRTFSSSRMVQQSISDLIAHLEVEQQQ